MESFTETGVRSIIIVEDWFIAWEGSLLAWEGSFTAREDTVTDVKL